MLQDNPLAFLLSTVILLVTASSFVALSVALHSSYLWLAVVVITLVFLATFTCTYSLPGYFVQHVPPVMNPTTDGESNISFEAEASLPYLVTVDLPPSYDVVMGLSPPSYSKATSGALKLELTVIPELEPVETCGVHPWTH